MLLLLLAVALRVAVASLEGVWGLALAPPPVSCTAMRADAVDAATPRVPKRGAALLLRAGTGGGLPRAILAALAKGQGGCW